MSHVRIWVHAVFTTKDRQALLQKDIRKIVFEHISENCKKKGIYLRNVNGHLDHAHCLLSLGNDQSISEVMQLIKGESSYWINKNQLTNSKFSWQDDYFAVSVCESEVERVGNYINNQEEHHTNKTFSEELDELIKEHGFKLMH